MELAVTFPTRDALRAFMRRFPNTGVYVRSPGATLTVECHYCRGPAEECDRRSILATAAELGGAPVADEAVLLDLSEVTGDARPVSLETLLSDNAECPPSDEEVDELRAARVGQVVHLGIGGGAVAVRRVA